MAAFFILNMGTLMSEPTVTIKDVAPSVVAASDDVFVTDAKGRKIKIQAPDVLFESRLIRMVGQESAMNTAYMYGYCMPAVNAVEIDGEPVKFPTSVLQLEAIITRLGHDGLNAILSYQKQKVDELVAQAEQLKN
jgi:hypothetical protein